MKTQLTRLLITLGLSAGIFSANAWDWEGPCLQACLAELEVCEYNGTPRYTCFQQFRECRAHCPR